MNDPGHHDGNLRPLMLLGGSVLFVAALLIADGMIGKEKPEERNVNLPGGGAVSLFPGAPLPNLPGGSPVPDGGPSVTIIQDVRETMNRLPLDRNTPPGAEPYRPRISTPKRKPG